MLQYKLTGLCNAYASISVNANASPNRTHVQSSAPPLHIQNHCTVTASVNRNLFSTRRHTISSEVGTTIIHQPSTLRPKNAPLNTRPASESAVQNPAVALGRAQSEISFSPLRHSSGRIAVDLRSCVSRARARDVPLAVRDEAAFARAGDLHVQASFAAEGTAGGGWSRTTGGVGCGSCGRGAGALGQVLDARGGTLRSSQGDGGLEVAGFQRAADVEEVPDLVQGAAGAAEVDFLAVFGAEGCLDFGRSVRFSGGRGDSGFGEEFVGGQGLEEGDGAVEEDGDFGCGGVVGVAGRVEGRDAGAVFAPLVLPEGLVVALVVFPVLLHHGQGVVGARGAQDFGDVFVGAARVAVGFVGAVTVIGP